MYNNVVNNITRQVFLQMLSLASYEFQGFVLQVVPQDQRDAQRVDGRLSVGKGKVSSSCQPSLRHQCFGTNWCRNKHNVGSINETYTTKLPESSRVSHLSP